MESAILRRIRLAYELQLGALVGWRIRIGTNVFLLFGAVVTMLEYAYFPDRGNVLAGVFGLYTAICAGARAARRVWPGRAPAIAAAGSLLLLAAMTSYHATAGTNGEMCAVTLALYCIATAVIMPWSGASQALTAAGAVTSYLVSVAGGLTLTWPLPYELAALGAVAFLTTLHSRLATERRWVTFRDDADARLERDELRDTLRRAKEELGRFEEPRG